MARAGSLPRRSVCDAVKTADGCIASVLPEVVAVASQILAPAPGG